MRMEHILPEKIRYPQEMKCPVCLLVDTSSSMSGEPIKEVNRGLEALRAELLNDEKARKVVDLMVVSFGGSVELVSDFCQVEDFHPPQLEAKGNTPMGTAILEALQRLGSRKEEYKQQGIIKFRTWFLVLTDGEPNDMFEGDENWNVVRDSLIEAEKNKQIISWVFGTKSCNFNRMKDLMPGCDSFYKLEGFNYTRLFKWLSDSLAMVSHSNEGDVVTLQQPEGVKVEV